MCLHLKTCIDAARSCCVCGALHNGISKSAPTCASQKGALVKGGLGGTECQGGAGTCGRTPSSVRATLWRLPAASPAATAEKQASKAEVISLRMPAAIEDGSRRKQSPVPSTRTLASKRTGLRSMLVCMLFNIMITPIWADHIAAERLLPIAHDSDMTCNRCLV